MSKNTQKTPNKTWQPPSLKEVRDAVRASGYPLEVAVALAAEREEFVATPSWTWFDARTGKVREIDVVCSTDLYSDDCILNLHVLIECKRYRSGIIVFEYDVTRRDVLRRSSQGFDDSHCWGQPGAIIREPGATGGAPLATAIGWGTLHWPCSLHTGVQFALVNGANVNADKVNRQLTVSNGDAYEPIDGLMRGFLTYQSEEGLAGPEFPDSLINLGVLLLVVDGPIYSYRAPQSGRRGAFSKVHEATLIRRNVIDNSARVMRIDIVPARRLQSYLQRLRGDISAIRDKLRGQRELLRESVSRFGNTAKRHA